MGAALSTMSDALSTVGDALFAKKVKFSTKQLNNKRLRIEARTNNGDIYRNIISDFETTQYPEKLIIPDRCREIVIQNVSNTFYKFSDDLKKIKCTVLIFGDISFTFNLYSVEGRY